ncbi:MAG: hypothetical protein IPK82_33870 [Polyangiaceae bacterium]|nr:hypothetical protein [Polyangiaceae bacterium]
MTTTATRTAKDLQRDAEKWSHQDLLSLWNQIKAGAPIPGFANGKAFEYLVIRAFQLEKTDVRWPFHVTYPQKFGTMEQVDGIVYLPQRAFLIESKDLSEPAAIEAVAKLRFRLESRPPSTMGVLFSVRDFSLPTEVFTQFASPLNVLLWGSSDLDIALASKSMTEGLRQKLEFATEYGLPLYAFGDSK